MNLTLVNRLRGLYTTPVNDGGGLLDGKDTFTRRFPVAPIMLEAAQRIEELEAACAAALHSVAHYNFAGDVLWVNPPHQAEAVHESVVERLAAVLGFADDVDLNRECNSCSGSGVCGGRDMCASCMGTGVGA